PVRGEDEEAGPRRHGADLVARVEAAVRFVVVVAEVVVDAVVGVLLHVEEDVGERQHAARVPGGLVVVDARVRAVLELESAHVARRPVVVDADVVRLPDVDARVVGAGGDVAAHTPGAAVRREDAVLGVVVRTTGGDAPVVDAEEEDAVATEAVYGEASDARTADTLGGVTDTRGAVRALLRDGDPLILSACVLEHDGAGAAGLGHERDAVLVDHDGAHVPRLGRAGPPRLVIRAGRDHHDVTRARLIDRRLNRVP